MIMARTFIQQDLCLYKNIYKHYKYCKFTIVPDSPLPKIRSE